jgi:hypothetical protein
VAITHQKLADLHFDVLNTSLLTWFDPLELLSLS